MTRLAAYLVRMFSADALALFGVASLLLFLAQCLRSFDVVSVKGQDLLTLFGQALLIMPTLAVAFSHVCIGIGLARGLRALQLSQELHIIHSSRRMPALFRGHRDLRGGRGGPCALAHQLHRADDQAVLQ